MEHFFFYYEPDNVALSLLVWGEETCLGFHLEMLIMSALVMYRNKWHAFLYFLYLTFNFSGHTIGKREVESSSHSTGISSNNSMAKGPQGPAFWVHI